MPSYVNFKAQEVVDGISMRVLRQYDINSASYPLRIDVLCGSVVQRPQLACRIIGYEPSEVATLERAQASGMIGDFSDVEVLGTIEPHHFKRLVRGPIARSKDSDGFFVTATSVDLKVTAACTRCRACIGACPVGAITDSGRRVAIDRQLCLNCYHCLAVCPEDAIRIDPSPMNSVVRGVRAVTGI